MRCVVCALSSCLAGIVFAGSAELGIQPVRVTLSVKAPASQLEAGNAGDAPDLLQSQIYVWTRHNCVDALEPTDAVVVSPPIFTVEPNSKQVVRILLINQDAEPQERTLRVVFTEIGAAQPDAGSVSTRLAVSLPRFVLPAVPAAPKLEWAVARESAILRVTVRNAGNAHTRLRALRLTAKDGTLIAEETHTDYLLAGDSCNWSLPAEHLTPGATLVAVTEERETTLAVPTS
jgi:fimbrial chaperone protein